MRSPGGRLTLQGYLDLGKKQAHAFNAEGRAELYPLFEKYEALKRELCRYDVTDVMHSILSRLEDGGGAWRGVPIHALYRDEVQDFSAGELLLDMRLVAHPSGLFYCGALCLVF